MCCFAAALWFFGPRVGLLIYWLLPYGQARIQSAYNWWLIPLLGLIFLPWTTLVYIIVTPVHGLGWLWIGLAVIADFIGYRGAYRTRRDVPGYNGP